MTLVFKDCGSFSKAEIPFDTDLLNCHTFNPQRYPFLLESHHLNDTNTGFDILFAFPGEKIESYELDDPSFFTTFDQRFHDLKKSLTKTIDNSFPFTGGWFVFLSYELIAAIESRLSTIKTSGSLPVASAVRIPVAIIKKHQDKTCWIVCETGQEALIDKVWSDLQRLDNSYETTRPEVLLEEDDPALFINGVEKIKSYLIEGDIFQVNLSRQWQGQLLNKTNYLDIYRALRQYNPSPFAGLARFGDSVICSSSPERLVSCTDHIVQMRPIAGTRPRNDDDFVDKKLADELLENSKENAEHIMLIDLIRNDLGRVCQTGSVHVDEHMSLESYAAVHHIVSNVRGELLADVSPTDIIKAVFPGGTITGCPKIRCMEIIDELENTSRGAYTGSMGYINKNGDLDLNILIRTLTISGEQISFRTGAGIVADSTAENELQETRHKAKAILNALNIHAA